MQIDYQPQRLHIGMVRHYVKSNLDGSNAAQVLFYVASPTRIEVLKIETGSDVLAYIVAELDWSRASAVELHSWHVLPKAADASAAAPGVLRAQATGWLDALTREFRAVLPLGAGHVTVGSSPFHLYNFDLMSLNATLPGWRDPEATLVFHVIDPDFSAQSGGNFLLSRGEATLRYSGRERYGGVDCRAYALGGPGMSNRDGRLWADVATGYMVAIEHPLPDNPAWNSFKLALRSVEHMDRGAWLSFVAAARA
jgi:hypothetical protein